MITSQHFGHVDYGRFGNQLFQYSLCKVLSIYHDCFFYLNPSNHFLSFFDISKLTYKKLDKKINHYSYIEKDPYYFDKDIFSYPKIDILGFFQNLSYYQNYISDLQKELTPNLIIVKNTIEYIKSKSYNNFDLDKTICIHVRRTDYTQLQNKHGFLDAQYYFDILNQNNLLNYNIFIISDDIKYVKNEFSQIFNLDNLHYVDDLDVYHDYCIMYLSRINLLANSTYSWWSALLSDKNNKEVYAPYPWINQSEYANTKELSSNINLYPKYWKKVNYTLKKWDKLFI